FKKHISTAQNDIGALIEAPGLYPFLTGYDNMKLIDEDPDNKNIDLIIKELKMEKFIHTKVKTYSLGMKQKLGIALAFLNHPQLVILDEPMNGLDPKAVKNVREAIISLREQGVTFLISSHILSELVKVTDSILIIDDGEIIKETTMDELNQSGESDLENVLLNIIDRKEEV
ncbi:ATP-binding cassette domain-containing protein, partial [Staphylococcus xylosus]